MRKRWQWLLLALTGLFLLMFSPPLVSQAREVIEATGNDVNSAVIKDSAGNVISHDAQLPADADSIPSIINGVFQTMLRLRPAIP